MQLVGKASLAESDKITLEVRREGAEREREMEREGPRKKTP